MKKRSVVLVFAAAALLMPLSLQAKGKKVEVKKYQIRVSSAECFLVKPDGSHWDGTGKSGDLIKIAAGAVAVTGGGALPAGIAAAAASLLNSTTAAPDPYYKLTVDGKLVFTSRPVKDTYTPNWSGGTKEISVRSDSTVEIVVIDKDIKNDDPMETFQIGADQLEKAAQKGRLTLKGDKGIAELRIEVRTMD